MRGCFKGNTVSAQGGAADGIKADRVHYRAKQIREDELEIKL